MKRLILVLMLCSGGAWAQVDPGTVSRVSHEVSMEVYSPFCPGKTLAMCPSPNAAEVRMDIQAMAGEGMEKEAIKEAVLAKYGEEFRLQEPPASDNAMLFVVILMTLGVVIGLVRWFGRKPVISETVEESVVEDDGYLEELREQL